MDSNSQSESLEALFNRFKTFSQNTFTQADAESYLIKLEEEVAELKEDLDIEELADCILVLVGLSRFIPGDLKNALKAKIEKNEKRKWDRLSDGTYHHVKE